MRKAQIPTAHQFGELFSELLKSAGLDALYTRQLPAQNRTTDEVLKRLSVTEQRMVGTKDLDFYHSHLLHGRPWKLLFVRTGNIGTRDRKALFERHLPEIVAALEVNWLVELDRQSVHVIVWQGKSTLEPERRSGIRSGYSKARQADGTSSTPQPPQNCSKA